MSKTTYERKACPGDTVSFGVPLHRWSPCPTRTNTAKEAPRAIGCAVAQSPSPSPKREERQAFEKATLELCGINQGTSLAGPASWFRGARRKLLIFRTATRSQTRLRW